MIWLLNSITGCSSHDELRRKHLRHTICHFSCPFTSISRHIRHLISLYGHHIFNLAPCPAHLFARTLRYDTSLLSCHISLHITSFKPSSNCFTPQPSLGRHSAAATNSNDNSSGSGISLMYLISCDTAEAMSFQKEERASYTPVALYFFFPLFSQTKIISFLHCVFSPCLLR